MDLIKFLLSGIDPNLFGILATALFGIFAWLVKSLIEDPLNNSKETFNKILYERIEILTEIKNHLAFISFFPEGTDNLEYKEKLQALILRNGKTAFVDQKTLAEIIDLSIRQETDQKKVTELIKKIQGDLKPWINKAKEDNTFYEKYYSPFPIKRIWSVFKLGLINSIGLLILFSIIFLILNFLVSLWQRILI